MHHRAIDQYAPAYLERCRRALRAEQASLLSLSSWYWYDAQGDVLHWYDGDIDDRNAVAGAHARRLGYGFSHVYTRSLALGTAEFAPVAHVAKSDDTSDKDKDCGDEDSGGKRGGFRHVSFGEDYDLAMACVSAGGRAVCYRDRIDQACVLHIQHGDNASTPPSHHRAELPPPPPPLAASASR